MYQLILEYVLMGNSIVWDQKAIQQLLVIPTEQVTLSFDQKTKRVDKYVISTLTEFHGEMMAQKVIDIEKKEVIHPKRPNPSSLLWGLSPFIPGRKSVLFNRYTSDYLNSFYLKQATPGFVLEMDRAINEENALRQLRSFEMAYTGRRNQRRTLILPKGIKANPVTHTITDQKIIELVNQNRETIINLFKIPKHELGMQTAGSLGSEEYKTALKNFWVSTLIPTMRMVSSSFTKHFKNQLGEGYFFDFDISGVEILREDQMEKALLAKEMANTLGINEANQRVWDEQAIDAPGANIPLLIKEPSQPQFFNAKPPETGEPVDNFEAEIEQEIQRMFHPDVQKILNKRPNWFNETAKALTDVSDGQEGKIFEDIVMETIISMSEATVPVLNDYLVDKTQKAADIPDKRELRKRLEKVMDQFNEVWVDSYIEALEAKIDIGYNTQTQFVFNFDASREVDVLRQRNAQKRRAILEARGIESFSQISKTHTERIMREIIRGVDANETVDQVARRIADTFTDPESVRGKARTIARTEILTAVSIGQNAAAQDAKEVIPGLKKAWITADDERVRDSHTQAQDQGPIDMDEEFSNGLKYPRDVSSGDPGEVINCRCTLILVPPEEE